MNIIKTVGDLRKALSAYDESLPFEVNMIDGTARTDPIRGSFNNDTALCKEIRLDINGREISPPKLVITAIRNA